MPPDRDEEWLNSAARLAARGQPLSRPNPSVGALIVGQDGVVGRGWTQAGGRPHAEAVALAQAGPLAQDATLFVTLEPCAHESERGPSCTSLIARSALARVVIGCSDPDPRTAGLGIQRLREAGKQVDLLDCPAARQSLEGYLCQRQENRPHVTLKLALSTDGRLTPGTGAGQWLTGEVARRHVHAWRARMDAILVGRGTFEADHPRLDVRLPGIEERSPQRFLLTQGNAPAGWTGLASPDAIANLTAIQYLMVEGGAHAAQTFSDAGMVDRLAIYRAPLTVGGTGPQLPQFAGPVLAQNAFWKRVDTRQLGNDTLEVYERS